MGWGKLSTIATIIVLVLYFVGGFLIDAAQEHRRANQLAEAVPPAEPAPAEEPDIAPGPEDAAEDPELAAADGEEVYMRVCVACHGAEGQGVPATFPPLTETEWVTGDPSIPTRVVLKGLAGPITVKGTTYNNAMPGWEASLDDAEVAAVVNYIRSSWGNDAEPIEPDFVQELRQQYADRAQPFSAGDLGMN